MMSRVLLVLIASTLCGASAAEEAELTTPKQKASYAYGLRVGQNIAAQSVELDREAVLLGIQDVLRELESRIPMEELQASLVAYQQEVLASRARAAEENLRAAVEFMSANKEREDVVALESGLQYRVLVSGEGDRHPAPDGTVLVHYSGRFVDGEEFDSSYGRGEPTQLQIDQVIAGWQEALVLMVAGDTWEVFVPPELGYGENGAGSTIGPNQALIFKIELIELR